MNTSRDIGEIEIQPCGAGCSSEFQPELRRRSLRDEAHEYCFCYLVATVNTKNKHHKLTDIMIVPRVRLSYTCAQDTSGNMCRFSRQLPCPLIFKSNISFITEIFQFL